MSSSSDSGSSRDQMINMDLENNRRAREEKRQHLVRIWKIPVPVRKGHMLSDIVKNIAILMTALCIVQAVYIYNLQAGLIRVPNDPYDNTFWKQKWHQPSVWDTNRQAFLHNAMPVPVHSHNDYWRAIPVHEALASGCVSIEADVYLRNGDLLVGHDSHSLHNDMTLRSMYIDPLKRMLDSQNADVTTGTWMSGDAWRGIFDQKPQQTVVLLIDHKTSGVETFDELNSQLQTLRDANYLTYWNGTDRNMRAITVVASGKAPFRSVMALNSNHRDIFWDAKLEQLLSINDNFAVDPPVYGYNISNSYYASTLFKNGRFYPAWHNETDWEPSGPMEKDIALSQIDQAKARGLISRYWDTPSHPPNLKEIVWRVLVDAKVGVMNMDDMGAVRARAHGWGTVGS